MGVVFFLQYFFYRVKLRVIPLTPFKGGSLTPTFLSLKRLEMKGIRTGPFPPLKGVRGMSCFPMNHSLFLKTQKV